MEIIRRKKKTRQREKKFVVLFQDAVDYTELASILIGHLETAFTQSAAVALHYAETDLDPVTFGEQLALIFTPEDIQELMSISQGPGILIGMYLAKREFENVSEDSEELY